MRHLLFALLLLITTGGAWAQDTRGILVPDAQVLLADNTWVKAEDVKVGAVLWAWLPEGRPGTAKVTATRRQHADSFILLKAGEKELRASGSHRIAAAGGKLVRLDTVKVGDKVWVGGPGAPTEAVVTSVRLYPANMVAYDLTVEGRRPFSVGGVVVGD